MGNGYPRAPRARTDETRGALIHAFQHERPGHDWQRVVRRAAFKQAAKIAKWKIVGPQTRLPRTRR